MSAAAVQVGRVRYERHGHVLKMVIDKPGPNERDRFRLDPVHLTSGLNTGRAAFLFRPVREHSAADAPRIRPSPYTTASGRPSAYPSPRRGLSDR